MKLVKLTLILIFFIFVSSVNAFLIVDVSCNKDGSVDLVLRGEQDDKLYTKDINVKATSLTWYDLPISNFDVSGKWDRNRINGNIFSNFKSDEALFNNPGKYLVEVNYEGNVAKYNLEDCIGLIFSCKLMHLEIKNCSTVDNKYFSALLQITGLEQSDARRIDFLDDIKYELEAEKRYDDYRGKFSTIGSWPKGFKLDKLSNHEYFFSYEFKDNYIKNLKAEFKGLSKCEKYGIKLLGRKECDIIQTKIESFDGDKEKSNEKITGNVVQKIPKKVIFTKEKSNNLIFLLISSFIVIFIVFLTIILKNKKVNKWV